MTTITEDYVSFETAKLLKEKGFPQEYDDFHALVYNEEDYEDEYEVQRMVFQTQLIKAGTLSSYPVGVPDPKCYCPTLQMTMKWLREVHGLFISIGNDDLDYNWQIFDIKNRTKDLDPTCLTDSYAGYRKYEQACEAAIKYCLENLI